MRKLIIATITLLIGSAITMTVQLWVDCPDEEWIETVIRRDIAIAYSQSENEWIQKEYRMGIHGLDPLFTYHHHGLFVVVRDGITPVAIAVWGDYYWL